VNAETVATEVKIISVTKLREHELQNELSPLMTGKSWENFLEGIRKNGIILPLMALPDGRVIDGKQRLRAARELGISGVRVIFEDIPENDLPTYISETKLNRDDLTNGQKAAIVINLYYEEERQKSKANSLANLKQNADSSELENREVNGETAEKLRKKSGVSKTNIYYLLAVKKNRPDLYAKVFDGSYTIGKAHAEMKKDEESKDTQQEKPQNVAKEVIEKALEKEVDLPQEIADEPATSPSNKIINTRKNALSTAVSISYDSDLLKEVSDEKVKDSYLEQIKALAKTCIIALGENAKSQDDAEVAYLCLELLNKINGGSVDE
jgi:hypothetical protein